MMLRKKAHKSGAGHDCVFSEPAERKYTVDAVTTVMVVAACECLHTHLEEIGTRNGLCIDLEGVPDEDGTMPTYEAKVETIAAAVVEWLKRTVVPDVLARRSKLN